MKRQKPSRMEFKLKPHPSGHPKPRERYRALGFRRPPPDEPLTPGLRRSHEIYDIGFHRGLYSPDDED